VRCPKCGRSETGRVGNHEFFCWDCCVEFHGAPGNWRLFAVDTDGALVELRPEGEPGPAEVGEPVATETLQSVAGGI
jgi:hypothetical protein